jgi:hypothetical protein
MWRFHDKWQTFTDRIEAGEVGSFLSEEFLGGGEPRLINISVWPWMWLYLLAGVPATYNLLFFLSFVLSGYAMYLLVSYWVERDPKRKAWIQELPAFLTGLFYMFLPFHAAHAQGHFGAMQLQWIPLILLVFLCLWRSFSWPALLGLWALLTVQAWSEHHYALWLGILAVIAALVYWKQVQSFFREHGVWPWLALGALLVLSVGLPYLPTMRLSGVNDSLELGQAQTIRFSADLFSFIVPAPFHPLWGSVFHTLFSKSFTGNETEATQFIGWVPLLLIIFFRKSIPAAQRKFWVMVIGIFTLIMLGPRLHVFGHVLSFPMPYALIDSWPVFSSIRAVARGGAMIGVSTAILLFWVLKANVHRLGSAIIFGLIVLLEFLMVPFPSQPSTLSAVYQAIDKANGSSVIEIPAATNYTAASRALFASVFHGKRVLGNIALERAADQEDFALVKSVPAVRQLLYLRTVDLRRDRSEFFAQSLAEALPDALKFLDVGEIIIHTDSLTVLQLSTLRGFLEEDVGLSAQEYDDAILYHVPENFTVHHDGVFLMRDARWQAVGFDPKRSHVYGEVNPEAAVTLVNVTEVSVPMRIRLSLAPESPAALRLTLGDKVIGEIKPGGVGVYPVAALPGKTVISLSSTGKAIVQDPELLFGQ